MPDRVGDGRLETSIYRVFDIEQDAAALDRAAALLRAGRLVVIPTETVYGLAADALNPSAASAIYAAKGRPSDNPLIVHIADPEQARPLVKRLPDAYFALAERFWPGPMTVILEKSARVPYETSGGLETVALRMPSHPVARELIRRAGTPLAAPSANLSGSPSPTCAGHCIQDLTGRVDAIIDGGSCTVGVESTVLTLCTDPPAILRPGAVTLEMLREVLPDIRLDPGVFAHLPDGAKAASPGMKYRHYAPKARVVLLWGTLEQFAAYLEVQPPGCGVLCFEGEQARFGGHPCVTYGRRDDPVSQAQALFGALRRIDELGLTSVYARVDSPDGVGQAVYNRLLRAAGFTEVRLGWEESAT